MGAEDGFAVELGYIVGRFRTEGSSALILIYPGFLIFELLKHIINADDFKIDTVDYNI